MPAAGAVQRGLGRIVSLAAPSPGFIGAGHTAIHAIAAQDFLLNDPFIMLADDRLDLPPGGRAGAAHPHAGFEIATVIVDGDLDDRDEGLLRAGDVAFMTAGSGVVHSEDVEPRGRVRILQLWVTLPSASRWAGPRFEIAKGADAPVRTEPGVEARVYSGASGPVSVPPRTYLPMTTVDIRLDANAAIDQELPGSYNGFLYPLEGTLLAGRTGPQQLGVGQIGWLEPGNGAPSTNLRLTAGPSGARVVLFAGERQDVPIVTHGPFVAESRADLMRLGNAYSHGGMPRISELGGAAPIAVAQGTGGRS
jgi:redox-sensitive bicupin YhaK (pirin superfamily)